MGKVQIPRDCHSVRSPSHLEQDKMPREESSQGAMGTRDVSEDAILAGEPPAQHTRNDPHQTPDSRYLQQNGKVVWSHHVWGVVGYAAIDKWKSEIQGHWRVLSKHMISVLQQFLRVCAEDRMQKGECGKETHSQR